MKGFNRVFTPTKSFNLESRGWLYNNDMWFDVDGYTFPNKGMFDIFFVNMTGPRRNQIHDFKWRSISVTAIRNELEVIGWGVTLPKGYR